METFPRPRKAAQPPISQLLLRLARRYAAQEARDLRELVMGPAQRVLLDLVAAEPGLSMTAAAGLLGVDKAAVTRTAQRLERNGFVERRRPLGGSDRRVRELYPTAAGRAVRWVADPSDISPDARLVAGFPDDDLARLHLYFARMDANLDVPVADFVRRLVLGPPRVPMPRD